MLSAVISLACPELRVRLALEKIASPNKDFSQTKLIVAGGVIKIGVAGGVRGICFQHDLGMKPGLIGVVVRIHPIVNKDEFPVGFSFVSKAVFCARTGRLECDLLSTFTIYSI